MQMDVIIIIIYIEHTNKKFRTLDTIRIGIIYRK